MKNLCKTTALSLLVLVVLACETNQTTIPQPGQTISPKAARQLQQEYVTTRAAVIKEQLGYEDARDFWFSLDSLKNYIAYVEQEAKNKNLTNLGLRVYFAAYPANSKYANAGYATVFLAPTAQQASSPLKSNFAATQEDNENIEGVAPLNYAHAGKPPKAY